MKCGIVKICCLAVWLALGAGSTWAMDPIVEKLSAKPVEELADVPMDVRTLPSGALFYYAQSRELPIVHMTVFFETGELYDPKNLRGISPFFIGALRNAGTVKFPSKVIDEKLEILAAAIGSKSESELLTLSVQCLQKDVGPVLDILFSMVREPAFEPDRLEILRKSALYGIKRRNEDPLPIATREFEQSLFGKDSPHAWLPTPETIAAIGPETLRKYFEDRIAPNRMRIAATSQLSTDEFQQLVDARLAGWNKTLPKTPFPTNLKKEWEPSVEFVQKEGNQSSIVIGHFGEKRFNEDKYKLILANEILGGATFGARLGDQIRTKLGLAYSVGSGFEFATDYGSFRIVVQTKSESTVRTLSEITRILTDMVSQKNLTVSEIQFAKDKLLTSMVFEYETPFNIVSTSLRYDFFGYPKNYLSYYQKALRQVSVDDVNKALPRYFFPDKLKILIVGDKSKIPDLNTLSGLREIPLDNE